MEQLKSLIEDGRQVNLALQKLSPNFGGFYNERAETLIVDILKDVMDDKDDWIGYYIYELDWGKEYRRGCIKDKNSKNIKLKTLTDLYNIFKEEI